MSTQSAEVTAAACRYILVGLLQRLESGQPGLLTGMRDGIEADQRAAESEGGLPPNVAGTFAEALRILQIASGGG